MIAEPIQVLLSIVERLDRLRIEYAVGGSLSSSVFGEPRGLEELLARALAGAGVTDAG